MPARTHARIHAHYPLKILKCHTLHERPRFGYYSLWLVVNKARMDIVLPACFQIEKLRARALSIVLQAHISVLHHA